MCVTELQRCRDEYADATFSADLLKADAGWDAPPPLLASMAAALTDEAFPQKTKDILVAASDGHVSQAKLLEKLIEARYPDTIDSVLCRRVAALIARLHCSERFPQDTIAAAAQLMIDELRRHPPIFAWLLVRTWVQLADSTAYPEGHHRLCLLMRSGCGGCAALRIVLPGCLLGTVESPPGTLQG